MTKPLPPVKRVGRFFILLTAWLNQKVTISIPGEEMSALIGNSCQLTRQKQNVMPASCRVQPRACMYMGMLSDDMIQPGYLAALRNATLTDKLLCLPNPDLHIDRFQSCLIFFRYCKCK